MSGEAKHSYRNLGERVLTCMVQGRLMTIQPKLGALIAFGKISLKK